MKIKLLPFLNAPYWQQVRTLFWRNSKNVTIYFQIKHISLITHLKWLSSLKKKNPKNIAFFIYSNNTPIGVTYFHSINYQERVADWGIYIYKKDYRNKGIGNQVLKLCISYGKTKLKLGRLFLDVLETNNRAVHVYQKNGFIQIAKKGKFLRYQLDLK